MFFREPRADVVLIAVLGVRIDDRVGLAVPVQGKQHGIGDVRFADSEQRRFFPVHDHVDFGIIFFATDLNIGHARNLMHDFLHVMNDGAGLFKVIPVNLDIDGFLRTEARHAFHQSSRVKEHRDAGKEFEDRGSHRIHDLDLVAAAFVGRRQIDGNDRRVRSGVGIEQGGTSLRKHACAGGDRLQFVRGDFCLQHPFDLGDLIHGFFHPLADRRPQDDPELTFIGDRQELGSDEGQQRERTDEDRHHGDQQGAAVSQHPA